MLFLVIRCENSCHKTKFWYWFREKIFIFSNVKAKSDRRFLVVMPMEEGGIMAL